MICKNCGSQVPEGAKFCIYCGSRLTDESVEYKEEIIYGTPGESTGQADSGTQAGQYTEVRDTYAADTQAQDQRPGTVYFYGNDQQTGQAGKKKSSSALIVVAVAFIAIIIIGAGMVKLGMDIFKDDTGSNTGDPTQTIETTVQFADTAEFSDFMMGMWTTKLNGNYFEITEDEEYYYYETDLPIENDAEHGWYVMDNVMYIYYEDEDFDEPYLMFNVRDENTVEIYSYQEDYTRVFHRN